MINVKEFHEQLEQEGKNEAERRMERRGRRRVRVREESLGESRRKVICMEYCM